MALREMMTDAQVIGHALEVIPDVGRLEELLAGNPGQQLVDAVDRNAPHSGRPPDALPDDDFGLIPIEPLPGVPEAPGLPDAPVLRVPHKPSRPFGEDQTIALVGEAAHSALGKIRRDGTGAQLDEEERLGLEAVVSIYGRPALLVENGRFRPPAPPWENLEQHRAAIEAALRSVGRIEVEGYPENDCVGTGFLVAADVVMTNRHVAKKFLALGGPPWQIEAGMTARIDFNEEFLAGEPREFAIIEVIAVSSTVDMALLRVATDDGTGRPLPPPLPLAGTMVAEAERDVYVIGYPFYNPVPGSNAEAMHRIFSDIYGIKRVQPGKVRSFVPATHELVHDCSTLGGNSGSCVIDLQTGDVVGLHRRGVYLEGNFAIALAQVRDDPAFDQANVQFSA